MEYVIVIILQLIGIGLHVMQKVVTFDRANPDKSMREVFSIFWDEDWNTLFISALVLAFNIVVHYIINNYAPEVKAMEYYLLYAFGTAFVLGYAGQRLIYKYLGTAEKFLDKKVDNKLQ